MRKPKFNKFMQSAESHSQFAEELVPETETAAEAVESVMEEALVEIAE